MRPWPYRAHPYLLTHSIPQLLAMGRFFRSSSRADTAGTARDSSKRLALSDEKAVSGFSRRVSRRTGNQPTPDASGGGDDLRLVPSSICQIFNRRFISDQR